MREIVVMDLAAALQRGATVLDVRQPAEYAEGHVPGSTNVPMSQLPERVADLEVDEPVHLICWSGNRSAAMADVVAASGRTPVNVAGGTSAWLQAGLPIEVGPR